MFLHILALQMLLSIQKIINYERQTKKKTVLYFLRKVPKIEFLQNRIENLISYQKVRKGSLY